MLQTSGVRRPHLRTTKRPGTDLSHIVIPPPHHQPGDPQFKLQGASRSRPYQVAKQVTAVLQTHATKTRFPEPATALTLNYHPAPEVSYHLPKASLFFSSFPSFFVSFLPSTPSSPFSTFCFLPFSKLALVSHLIPYLPHASPSPPSACSPAHRVVQRPPCQPVMCQPPRCTPGITCGVLM